MVWLAVAVGCGSGAPLRSEPATPTRDLSSPALTFPGDSPLAQFFPKGPVAMPTGPLGKLQLGMPEADARAVATAIAAPYDKAPAASPAPGVVGFGGKLDGLESIGFMVLARDGKVFAVDLSAPLEQVDGVFEMAWGPPTVTHLPDGSPGGHWENPASKLSVTVTNAGKGKSVVAFEALP